MLTRRDFLLTSGATLLAPITGRLGAGSLPPAAPLRVVVLRENADASARMNGGARMAADEVTRAGEMFGAAVGIRPIRWDGSIPRDADVIIGGMHDDTAVRIAALAEARRVVFVNVGSADDTLRGERCGAHTFHVAASEAMRRDARRVAGAPADAPVLLWHPALQAFGAAQLNDRHRHATTAPMDSDAWAGWFAVKAVAEAHFRRGGRSLRDALARDDARFDGHKGKPLSFRAWDRQLRQPLYVQRDAGEPVEVPGRGGTGTAREQLDTLGTRAADTRCRR